MLQTFNLQNPVIRSFLFYASILIGKTMIMSPLTARWRFKKGVFISPEDAILRGTRVGYDDADIERVRRAHRNDIENIPMFLAIGFIYILTEPNAWIAINLFRIYTFFRIVHTYVYAIHVFPQPVRAIVWSISYLINWNKKVLFHGKEIIIIMVMIIVDDVVRAFLFYTCVLVLKTLFMGILIWRQKVKMFSGRPTNSNIEIHIKERINRIKRAHVNDIENIPIFLVTALVYLLTQPDTDTAILLFRMFTFARIVHTFVYAVYVIPQPSRAIAFITGEVVTWYMILKCLYHFY